ncbi:coiled-coil domain-containing protein 125 [Tenrec ecaudatus]|uniref:coiled-coil domain-containing protein 125 n=1 Tax=Tenrec ecaudatus TaxID=94439 RepID=UPI003F5A533F
MSRAIRSLSDSEAQAWGAEDDMTDGDLGYGLGRRPGGIYEGDISCLLTSRRRWDGSNMSPPPCPRKGPESGGAISQFSKHKSVQGANSPGRRVPGDGRQGGADSNSELSNAELKQHLREALEEVEVLKTELEASQRQLEGKEEALKILQSMAILGKATSHTQAVLQKTVQQKRSLEKEINTLQWEIEFDQNRFKNIEESWIQKHDRLNCENAVLKETLKLKTEEVKILKSENAILNQRHLEALALLEVRQQTMAQEARGHSQNSCFTEASGLEPAVLRACLCHGPGGSPCSCAKTGASTRRLLLQLQHQLELSQKSKEEAYLMADAFRIAFEQQLMRKNDHALKWTQVDKLCQKATKPIDGKPLKEDGFLSRKSKKTLVQRLLGVLPSESGLKRSADADNPQEAFKMLIDLLNDKEEALAHQRKVSYMLARALEDRDTASRDSNGKKPGEETFSLKPPWRKASELPVLHDPINSNNHSFHSVNRMSSNPYPQADQNYARTLKKSHSLPSGIMF